jgi:hypothetical protein
MVTGSGRITFTATAANRVMASDAVDVPAIDSTGTIYSQVFPIITAVSATQITVTVTATATTGTPTVHLVAITGSATLSSGAAVGATGQASGSVWVFDRGAALGGNGQVQFRATLAGTQADDDFVEIPEQGQDTIYLVARARVTSSNATTVVVRVAVADPYPQGANSATISYSELGVTGTSPATGGTVTPASSITEAASTYIDYTITRPAFTSGTGRVTFTVTAANRVSDTDSVDIPAQEQTVFGPSLTVTPTPGSTSYSLAYTSTGTLTLSIDGGAYASPAASPIVVTRNAYLGATQVYTFKAVADGQTITATVNIPAVETNAAASFSIDSPQTADSGTDDYYYDWTVSGMPSGTTYNLLYKYTNTAGTLVEEGTVIGATSGGSIASTGTVGASPTYVMTVNAVNSGLVIATQSKVGIFTT